MENLTCRQAGALDPVVGLPAVASTNTDLTGTTSTVHAVDPTPAPSLLTHSPPCRVLTFGNGGGVLEFMEGDIPTPPVILFAENLALLNQMWDDAPSHWQGNSVLVICGVPIPIVYWKNIYSRLHGEWKGLKSNWSLWKASFSPFPICSRCSQVTAHPR